METVSAIKTTTAMQGGVPKQSYSILSSTFDIMASPGDSWAWLLDDDGKLLGLVHGGDIRYGMASVLPIQEIFGDIQRISGYAVELI